MITMTFNPKLFLVIYYIWTYITTIVVNSVSGHKPTRYKSTCTISDKDISQPSIIIMSPAIV